MKYETEVLKEADSDRFMENLAEEISQAIQNGAALESVISKALEMVVKAAHAEAGTFWFYHRFEDGRISPLAVCGSEKLEDIYLLPGEGIAGKVIDGGEPLLISDCQKDPRWSKKVDTETGFVTKSTLCVPMKANDWVFGSIQILNKTDGRGFEERDLLFVESMAERISHALKDHPILEDYHSETAPEKSLAKENDVNRAIIQRISTYMDPAILREILRKDGKHKKSLQMEEVVVLFVDIRGFTHLAEHLTPAQLISCLSDFLSITSQSIHCHGGTVDKFMGDCTMAYWRVREDAGAVTAACSAALEIQEKAKNYAARVQRQTGLQIGLGIGIHTGPALLCHVGDENYMAYTVIGDVVNTASRLEDNAPSGRTYVSRQVVEQLGEDGEATLLPGGISLKGKEQPIEVWSLTGLREA